MSEKQNYDLAIVRDYYPNSKIRYVSSWVHDQAKSLRDRETKLLAISPRPYLPFFLKKKYYYHPETTQSPEILDGIEIVRPSYFKFPRHYFYSISSRNLKKAIYKELHANNFKIIHAHFGQNGSACIKSKISLGIPLITSFYGYDSGRLSTKFKSAYSDLIKYGDIFLVLSNDMKSDLLKLGFPEDRIKIHHLGVKLDEFKSNHEDIDEIRFLVVSRFYKGKGLLDIVKAFHRISLKYEKTSLTMVGSGPTKKNVELLIQELGLSNKITFVNNYKSDNPRKVIRDLMAISHVFLLMSYTPKDGTKEGTPVVLMEAQSCSMPCISTDHAGIPEVVIDGKTGFIIKERDINQLFKKMCLFIENRSMIKDMGENARKHIEHNFNHNRQVDKLLQIYEDIGKHDS